MDLVTLDWETYYAKDFTLSKMTTEEYVRDPRFELIGVGVKFNGNTTRWFTDNGINEVIRLIPWHKVALLCHNTAFDGFILREKFGVVPMLYLDTLSMAKPWHGYNVGGSLKKLAEHYALGEKGTEVVNALGKRRADFSDVDLRQYGEYCRNDVELTYALFQKLKEKTPMQELLLIDRTLRMFCDPKLLIDQPLVMEELNSEVERKQALMQQVEEVAPKDVLMSNPQFALLLESLGVPVPTKISARTNKETYAFGKTDKAFTALLDYEGHNADLVQALVAARLGVKSTIGETRSQRFLGISQRGALPVDLQYCGALVTQRWSGGCLTGDTKVFILTHDGCEMEVPLLAVRDTDLVWDGEDYVEHDGVVFSGWQEVIEWDGVRGTADHKVFCTDGKTKSLSNAATSGAQLMDCRAPYSGVVESSSGAKQFNGLVPVPVRDGERGATI